MKKLTVMLILCSAVMLAGCQTKAPVNQGSKSGAGASGEKKISSKYENTEIVEIKEKMFVAQTNEIYVNAGDYLGKTIKYEGIFKIFPGSEPDITYRTVIRYGPGCCGTDGDCGFEVVWDKGYPEENDWVSVEGILEEYDEGGVKYLRLALNSLEIKTERGNEYVTQ